MTEGFRRRFLLASLDAPGEVGAFGGEPRRQPLSATGLLRTHSDTRIWVCDDPTLLSSVGRGDFVLFHDWADVRGVAQVWATSTRAVEVRRFTGIESPGTALGLVTLTNWQAATEDVHLRSLGLQDASREALLYRIEDEELLTTLAREYGTPYAMLADVVPDPFQFDVAPDGETREQPTESSTTAPGNPGAVDDLLLEQYRSLVEPTRLAWGAIGIVVLSIALVFAGVVTIPHTDPVRPSPLVGAGLTTVAIAIALATGVLVRAALVPRPGLDAVRTAAERTGITVAGSTDDRAHTEALEYHTRTSSSTADAVAAAAIRRGAFAAIALLAAIVGGILLGYGVGAQLTDALDPLAPAIAAGVPILILGTAAVAALIDPVSLHTRLAEVHRALRGDR